jgi:hypothetical protein
MKVVSKSWTTKVDQKGFYWLILEAYEGKLRKLCLKFNIGQTNLQLWMYFITFHIHPKYWPSKFKSQSTYWKCITLKHLWALGSCTPNTPTNFIVHLIFIKQWVMGTLLLLNSGWCAPYFPILGCNKLSIIWP